MDIYILGNVMSVENKIIDITIEEHVPFALILQFLDIDDSVYPPTEIPVDLTGYSLRGDIRNTLDDSAPIIASFTTSIVDAKQGAASISLSTADTSTIAIAASSNRDKYNPRQRFVGYYDLIMTRTTGSTSSSFRILEGKVFVSDGVTK